jgi:AcrR family transcriptional regulator
MDLFKQQGFNETSMEQIAEESDIAKVTLYKYFEVKEAIIAAYWQERIKIPNANCSNLLMLILIPVPAWKWLFVN